MLEFSVDGLCRNKFYSGEVIVVNIWEAMACDLIKKEENGGGVSISTVDQIKSPEDFSEEKED